MLLVKINSQSPTEAPWASHKTQELQTLKPQAMRASEALSGQTQAGCRNHSQPTVPPGLHAAPAANLDVQRGERCGLRVRNMSCQKWQGQQGKRLRHGGGLWSHQSPY